MRSLDVNGCIWKVVLHRPLHIASFVIEEVLHVNMQRIAGSPTIAGVLIYDSRDVLDEV